MTTVFDVAQRRLAGRTAVGAWATPGDLAAALDPHHAGVQTDALELIDRHLVDVDRGVIDRLIVTMPPQEGKSTRVTKIGTLWAMTRNPDRKCGIVAYGSDLANDFGRDVRSYITANQGDEGTLDIGLRIRRDSGAVSSWQLDGRRGGLRSIGLAGGLTGRPLDWLVIDDPVSNRAQAESVVFRQRAKNFWTSTGSTRLSPGAPVIVVQTRWHEDDLAGWLLQREDADRWVVLNVPAQADHDPAKGETDPLGRVPGEWMESARVNARTGRSRTSKDWEQIRVQAGTRDFTALYQGRPSPVEGTIWQKSWWQQYTTPQWVERPDGSRFAPRADGGGVMIQSWDMTFKDTAGSDWVVGQVWFTDGVSTYLLDQVRGHWAFPETVRQLIALSAKWPQAALKLVEDKANGPAVISSLQRRVPGLVGEEPHGSKESRAHGVSPYIEAGNVFIPDPLLPGCAWAGDFVEEAAAFPNGAHDDQVDAASQAITRLMLTPMLTGTAIVTEDDMDDDVASYRISDY